LLPVILALAIGFFWVHGFTSSTFRNGKAATLKYAGLENFNPLIKIAKLRLALIFGWPGTCNFFLYLRLAGVREKYQFNS